MARRTRHMMAMAAAALVVSMATAVDVGVDERWLQEWSSSSSGSGTDMPPMITPNSIPPSSSTPVPTSPVPPIVTTVSPSPTTPTATTPATTPPVPTTVPVIATPVPRPPGSPSTPTFDANGSPIADVTRMPPTGLDGSWTPIGGGGTNTASPASTTESRATRSPTSLDTNVRANDAPRTSDAQNPYTASDDSAVGEEESDSGSGASASGSDDLSGSMSSSSSFSSSSSSSSISIPPETTLPASSASASGSRGATTIPTATTVTTTRRPQSRFHKAAAYISVTSAVLCLVLLVGLHVFAFDAPWLNWPHEWLSANGWELLLYVGYLQQLASLSQMELLNMPSFVAQFSDAFAWSNFLIQRTAILQDDLVPRRRLDETAVVASTSTGLDAYGDRIGISANDLMANSVVGVAVVAAVLGAVFIALLVCGKKVPEDKFDLESSVVSHAAHVINYPTRRRGTLCVLGFGVVLWFLALYPLTTLATFDLETTHSNTALAVVVLLVFCGIVLGGLAFAILTKSDEQLMSVNSLKTFGALYADLTHGFRWFFLVTAATQVLLGVCVGAIREESTQLMVALIIVVGYLLTMLLCSPFTSQTPLLLTAAVCGVKILNYSVAFAFVSDKNISLAGRNRAGDTIVVLTMLVLLLWLARVLVMLVTFIRLFAERRHASNSESPAYYGARESVKTGVALETNPILGGSGVYVTMMMTPATSLGQRLGSEYSDSFDNGPPRRTARLAQL